MRLHLHPRIATRMSAYTLSVNGRTRSVDVDGSTPVLWVLRDTLGLTGTELWLWHGALRRLHSASRRQARPVVQCAGVGGRGQTDHDDRRVGWGGRPGRAT